LFLCFGLRYINWHRLGSKYGCFAMKDLWQLRLIDIPTNVLEILVFIFAPWWILQTSTNFFSPSSSSMHPFACGVFVYVMWTITFACHVELLLFYLLARSYNWT
jgi:hypothetical protein